MRKLLERHKEFFPEAFEFIFLDVEASALDDGYPIEVAWHSVSGESDSFLIKPMSHWQRTKHWSKKSQGIHNIDLQLLLKEGICPLSAAERLNNALNGKIILCDALAHDAEWLGELHSAADIAPVYQLTDIRYWFLAQGEIKSKAFKDILNPLNANKQHRALADCEAYMNAYSEWSKQFNLS